MPHSFREMLEIVLEVSDGGVNHAYLRTAAVGFENCEASVKQAACFAVLFQAK